MYYYDTKGAWDGLVGPISNKQYTLASEANAKFSRNAEENGVTRVHFDLRDTVAANHGPRAQVYMGAKSKALLWYSRPETSSTLTPCKEAVGSAPTPLCVIGQNSSSASVTFD